MLAIIFLNTWHHCFALYILMFQQKGRESLWLWKIISYQYSDLPLSDISSIQLVESILSKSASLLFHACVFANYIQILGWSIFRYIFHVVGGNDFVFALQGMETVSLWKTGHIIIIVIKNNHNCLWGAKRDLLWRAQSDMVLLTMSYDIYPTLQSKSLTPPHLSQIILWASLSSPAI